MDSGRTQPVLLGGLFIGVLSALPVVSWGNCCCCLWMLIGGAIAVYLRQQRMAASIDAAEGALVGLLAGLVGGVLGGLLSIPFERFQQDLILRIVESNPDFPSEVRELLENARTQGATWLGRIGGLAFSTVVATVFGLLGGLLGVAIFKRKAPPQPPTVIQHDPGVAM